MSAVSASIRRELRALLPIWAACGTAFVLASRFEPRYMPNLAAILFVFGCLALGAQSMGHEYAHRTVDLLLTQPIGRRRAFLIKFGVLAGMLTTFGAAGVFTLVEDTSVIQERAITPIQALAITILASLFITPYLTLACRSGIAGFLFTGSVVFMCGISVTFLFARWLGEGNGAAIHPAFWWPGVLVLSAFAAFGTWRLATRLEATEAPGGSFRLPFIGARGDRAASAEPTSRHPLIWLLRKELRLQQMSFVLAAIWAGCLGALYVRGQFDPRYIGGMMPLAFMAMGTLPLVIGSIASAEERQSGALAWQQLLPLPMERQWIVKAAVVMALALVLGGGIPAAALALVREAGDIRDWIAVAAFIMFVAGTALYVSTLTSSPVRAVVIAVFVLTVMSIAIPWMLFQIERALGPLYGGFGPNVPGALSLFAVPLLYFGSRNHASAERSADQLRRQVPWFALTLILAMLVMA